MWDINNPGSELAVRRRIYSPFLTPKRQLCLHRDSPLLNAGYSALQGLLCCKTPFLARGS